MKRMIKFLYLTRGIPIILLGALIIYFWSVFDRVFMPSYGSAVKKVDFFRNVNFNEDAEWLFVNTNMDYDTCGVIINHKALKEYSEDVIVRVSKECECTTPDNCLTLFKNGTKISDCCYCSWEPLSIEFGRLKEEFVPAELKHIIAHSIERHDFILDSLKQINNIYLLYPQDSIIEFPDQLKFDIKIVNKGQDIFKQEEPLEEEFQRIFKEGRYHVKAEWYLSEAGTPGKLGYHFIVDCDSSFPGYFEESKLNESDFFLERTDYEYTTKEFKIRYYEWNE